LNSGLRVEQPALSYLKYSKALLEIKLFGNGPFSRPSHRAYWKYRFKWRSFV
jgi:hypothetical protein